MNTNKNIIINLSLNKTENKIEKKIYNYLLNKSGFNSNNNLTNNSNCKIPNSKSGQMIKVCKKKTYKGPKKNTNTKLDIYKIIDLDSDTMNLFIQKIINILYEKKKINQNLNIEHFSRIIDNSKKNVKYFMVGNTYSINYKTKNNQNIKIFNLTQYIDKIINKIDNENKLMFDNNIKLFVKWIKDIFQSMDKLYKHIRFHHCDPKADQLFLVGKLDEKKIETENLKLDNETPKIILGDLDKVTFSIKIDGECYRIITKKVLNRLNSVNIMVNKINKSHTIRKKIESMLSPAEKMRYEFKHRKSNLLEKAHFLVSILLLIDNEKFTDELEKKLKSSNNNIFKDINILYGSINKLKLKQNKKRPFKEKRGLKIAGQCLYVESLYNNNKSDDNECSIINFVNK